MPVEAVAPQLAPFVEAFEKLPRNAWHRERFERFLELGFPTSRDEDWKFTNLAPLLRVPFENPEAGDVAAGEIVGRLPEADVVFVNGTRVTGTASADGPVCAEDSGRAFAALNAAFFTDPARFQIKAGNRLERPIHVVHVSLPGAKRQMTSPRNVFVFGEGSEGCVVETYVGEGTYFTNTVTQIIAGQGAVVEHVKIQQESNDAFHISTIQVTQNRDSVVSSRSFAMGGALARTEILAALEEGSECTLNGLYLVDGRRHVDTRTTIDHAKPHATSHELYKGILDGQASAVFNGKIIVRKDAQKTDAKQTNKNLVLSEDATINTKPQLEIFADDVRCTHGATVGQLDSESIFYLRSRGIGLEQARRMLIEAFAREILDGVKAREFREYLGRFL